MWRRIAGDYPGQWHLSSTIKQKHPIMIAVPVPATVVMLAKRTIGRNDNVSSVSLTDPSQSLTEGLTIVLAAVHMLGVFVSGANHHQLCSFPALLAAFVDS